MEEKTQQKAQEMYLELKQIEQQMKQLQKQIEAVEGQVMEILDVAESLDELKNIQEAKEILVPISNGIFAKAIIRSPDRFLVNVGANVVVEKSDLDTKKLVNRQSAELARFREGMARQLEKFAANAGHIEESLNKLLSE